MDYYVYFLLDPRKNNAPFYVGKGKDNRAWQHLSEDTHNKQYNQFKTNTINKIRKGGWEPIVLIHKDGLSDEEARQLECDLIAEYGRRGIDNNGTLTNRHIGGQGGDTSDFFTPYSRSKISAAHAGTKNASSKLSEEDVMKIYYSRETTKDICEQFNTSSGVVSGIKTKRYYKCILDAVEGEPGYHPSQRRIPLTDQTIINIFFFTGTPRQFKREFNISVTVARNIKLKKTYKRITESLNNPGEIILYGLAKDDIRYIHTSSEPTRLLAELFGVNKQTIRNIKLGRYNYPK